MNVAIIGIGLMGHPVAERLLETGHQVVVYNRTRGKAERLRSVGAVIASTPAEAVRSAACTLLVLQE
jgi:3-hydroxyisobutyrate dehydrogenase